jgi:propionyl-CoA synthetase
VAECCVVGLPDELKGSVPFAVIVRASSKEAESADLAEILKAVNNQVRTDIGAIASLGGLVSARLPKTRSGKTLRRTIKTLVENAVIGKYDAEAPFPPTIEDATAVDDARLQINTYFKAGGAKASKPKL